MWERHLALIVRTTECRRRERRGSRYILTGMRIFPIQFQHNWWQPFSDKCDGKFIIIGFGLIFALLIMHRANTNEGNRFLIQFTKYSNILTDFTLPEAFFMVHLLHNAICLLFATHCFVPESLLPGVCFLLPSAYCLLPTACFLLPNIYCSIEHHKW